MDAKRAAPKLDLDTSDFDAKLAAAKASLAAFGSSSSSAGIGGSGPGGSGSSGLDEGDDFGFPIPGGMMGGIGAAVASLSPGFGGAAVGLGALAGTGALAMSGIFKAVSAAHQASLQQQQYSQELAATEFQDSVAIQQAQLAIGQAHMQAAQDAANSANQIIMAEQAVGQAEHSLEDAQFSEQQAQVQLTEARIQAKLTLQQLQDQLAESKLAEQSASLALQQAQYQQMLTDQNAYSTLLDREQAALAVKQAEEQLTLAQQGRKNATMEASSTDRQYFDGEQQVIAAEHALTDAQYGVKQAMLQVTDAVRNLALTREDAAFTAQRDALAEQTAERNLTNTITEQRLALQEMKTASPYGQLARDMARLSPAGRQIARDLISMGGGLLKLEHVAQTAIAPGVLTFLRGVRSLWPEVKTGVEDMGKAISTAFGQFGKQMQTPAFAKVLDGLIKNGIIFVDTVLPAFAQFIQQLAITGSKKDAVGGLAAALAGIANVMTGIVRGLTPYTTGLTQFWQALASGLVMVAPSLGQFIGLLAQGSVPVLQFADMMLKILVPVMPLLTTAIAAVITPLTVLGQVWETSGKTISKSVSDMWNNYLKPTFQYIENEGIKPLESAALYLWHNVFQPVFNGIVSAARAFVSDFGAVWKTIEGVFKTPVNFLINTVYDNGIRKFWDMVVNAIGLKSLDMPPVAGLAHGGVLPGYAPGRDSIPAVLSPGEGVLTPQATQGIGGAPAVNALNQHYSGSSGQSPGVGGHLAKMLLRMPVREAARHTTERPAEHALGFAGGGTAGDGGDVSAHVGGNYGGGNLVGAVTGAVSGLSAIGRVVAALATGNTTALSNALNAYVGTKGATGELAQVMIGLPKTLIAQAVQQLVGAFAGGGPGGALPGGSTGAVGNLPANWKTIASFLAGHRFTKFAAAGVAGNIFAESGGDPEILQIGGGGGGGLIQWTPYPPGYITGNYTHDLYTQLNAILRWGGGPALVNRGTSPSNAAMIYQDYYERPASLTASLPARMASANAVYRAMGWGSFDSGGWLPPVPAGALPAGMPVNTTGQPEAIFSPEESSLLVPWLKRELSGQSGGGARPAPGATVNFNYFGPQTPTPEMQANMRRDMALQFGG
jgi:hypothetical protein